MNDLVSVVMPCFNEQRTILASVKRVLDAPFKKEVVLVDDGSTDGTRDVLRSEVEKLPGVRVFYQDRNRGKGAALRRGFEEAEGGIIIVQDADLEYDPCDIPTVVKPILDGDADVVYGSRFLGGPHRVLYFWHSVGNAMLTTASNMITDLNLTDMETCYKAFRAEVLKDITLKEDRFGFEPEVTVKMARRGDVRVYEVPITYKGRTYAEGKKIGLKDAFRAVYCLARYGFFDRG
ncbi:MAG: glycosyltransferase family 2 protein [Labilithrix sp.]|nr:glycosyltransferase family 2 protein [Labilithrix sp.]